MYEEIFLQKSQEFGGGALVGCNEMEVYSGEHFVF